MIPTCPPGTLGEALSQIQGKQGVGSRGASPCPGDEYKHPITTYALGHTREWKWLRLWGSQGAGLGDLRRRSAGPSSRLCGPSGGARLAGLDALHLDALHCCSLLPSPRLQQHRVQTPRHGLSRLPRFILSPPKDSRLGGRFHLSPTKRAHGKCGPSNE